MFPLAGLACRALMRARGASRRWFLRCCGEAQAPSCCRWFLSHFPHGSRGSHPIASGPRNAHPQEGDEAAELEEGEGEWRRQGWGKECLAVLTGLCAGDHLDSARRAPAVPCDSTTCASTATSSEGGRGFVFYPLPTCYRKYSGGDYDGGDHHDRQVILSGDLTVGRLESEFWGDKGLPKLLDIVAGRGHLDTLKWALSRFGGTDESWFLLKRLLFAAEGFQVDTIVWLANTINATERLSLQFEAWWWGVPRRASDIRRLIETFPEWHFDASGMARSAVNCKGPADEIIKVCEWLMQRFPSEEMDFTDSRNCEVVKWALEGVNSSLLETKLKYILHNADDVQFAQWLLERATPNQSDFTCACRNRKDNLAIAKLVRGRISITTSDSQVILVALHSALEGKNWRIAQWLEECFFNLTKTTPTLSLSKLLAVNALDALECFNEPAFKWAMQHLGAVGSTIPQSEVVDLLLEICASSHIDADTRDLALLLVESFRPRLGEWFSFLEYLKLAMGRGDLLQVKKIVHLSETQAGGLAPSDVLEYLAHYTSSSKVLKWLISHFNLEKEMTSKQKMEILVTLISRNKCTCAQWFAHKFSVTTEEQKVFQQPWFLVLGLDFAGWSLMLRMFPTIAKEDVIDHFLPTVASSPLLVLWWPDIVANEEYLTVGHHYRREETIWWLEEQGLLPRPATETTPNTDDDDPDDYSDGNGEKDLGCGEDRADTHETDAKSKSQAVANHKAVGEMEALALLNFTEKAHSYIVVKSMVEGFRMYMHEIGHGPEMWAWVTQMKEIVGVGVTDGMSNVHRRNYDLVACACTEVISRSISEFEALNYMVALCVEPFIGRLFEMASRDPIQGPNLTASQQSTRILKGLTWVPECRHLFVPFSNQLHLMVSKASGRSQEVEMFTCCINLVQVLPQFVRDLCDSFVGKLDGITQFTLLEPLLFWIDGWDVLKLHASNETVEFLKPITNLLIKGILKFCERSSLQEARIEVRMTGELVSKLTMLCSVDPPNGQRVVLQFIEDHIDRNNVYLQSVSALMIIPLLVTGGTVEENLVMKALMLACSDDSPSILEVLFSLKQVFHMMRSNGG
ncbi:hypothetical protein Pelo_11860 [Pelomyxa schiedti]|nr:hypothetical protein Pelo_11860 [Pelomyxa schiedti]